MIQIEDKYRTDVEKVYYFKQEHIFKFWDVLSDEEKLNLIKQIQNIDFELMKKLSKSALSSASLEKSDYSLETADIVTLEDRNHRDAEMRKLGEDLLSNGKVAAFLVAGGQGTRLGFDGPKGMYPVTPVRKKSLFQLHAEKLLALGNKNNKQIPWFIMTGETNHQQTITFFNKNRFFGYNRDNINFFCQEMVPAIDKNGKFILDAKDHIFTNPNGHGGSINALWKSGALDQMKHLGIEYIFYFQVDNVLANICDPVYLGYHVSENSEMSNKVVRKLYPEEKMGIICTINGKTGLIEYSDLNEGDMYATDEVGNIKYWAGSIAIHILNVDFVIKENSDGFKLPYHIAYKSIPFINSKGEIIKPNAKNGIKFETFVFEALMDAKKSISIEVDREQEFCPLKNKDGENSPETVKQDLNNLYGNWLEDTGIEIPRDSNNNVSVNLEISPFFALNQSDILTRNIGFKKIDSDLYLE